MNNFLLKCAQSVEHGRIIVIHGPTGAGKTECADKLADVFPIEIINMDMGQLYTPLTIGTAKPNWRDSPVPQHLFDLFDSPENGSAYSYTMHATEKINEILGRNHVPVLVGGSSFYLKSLLYTPTYTMNCQVDLSFYYDDADCHTWWKRLYDIDRERAKSIYPHDLYRIKRALVLWYSTDTKPSLLKPTFSPPGAMDIFFITRNNEDLYNRINKRVDHMIAAGWIDEVANLQNTDWEQFLRVKKIIGYVDILDYLASHTTKSQAISNIAQKTRHYAKRQKIFWKMLERTIAVAAERTSMLNEIVTYSTFNLT